MATTSRVSGPPRKRRQRFAAPKGKRRRLALIVEPVGVVALIREIVRTELQAARKGPRSA